MVRRRNMRRMRGDLATWRPWPAFPKSARPDSLQKRQIRPPRKISREGRSTSRLSAHALHLQRVETPVESVVRKQLVVTASLGDSTLVDHDDAVGVAHGGQTVGDDEHGAPAHEVGESL